MVDEPIVMREVREEGSFDAFFGDRFAELSRLAFLLTGSSGVADEIAQDACEQVLRRWGDITHPRAYARTAVVSGARAWGRRRASASAVGGARACSRRRRRARDAGGHRQVAHPSWVGPDAQGAVVTDPSFEDTEQRVRAAMTRLADGHRPDPDGHRPASNSSGRSGGVGSPSRGRWMLAAASIVVVATGLAAVVMVQRGGERRSGRRREPGTGRLGRR